jgi:hypothetical protein
MCFVWRQKTATPHPDAALSSAAYLAKLQREDEVRDKEESSSKNGMESGRVRA